ncbi:uridylate kinase [Yinghuangia soli]|uniref:Uridylate kinase n=1 Tax=Yinghuangia soli TaxID=2908204 RepID=A0AA41U1F5_9ACTN|nr:uridylate kinase [Yinghuangia soli]MCF2530743.1 uridylate kinase [Yinghuangia soli]
MGTGTRGELLELLADSVAAIAHPHPTRVGIDGPPAAGKTTLADELGDVLRARGRFVVRAQIEDFLLPEAIRFRRGKDDPEGCFHDSFDFDGLHRSLLGPLGAGGDRKFRCAVYDRYADAAVAEPLRTAPPDAVLLFDGVFLMRPELIDAWDLRVFLSVPFETTLARARVRDTNASRPAAEVERRYRSRYIRSQQYYLDTIGPVGLADVVVRNAVPNRPEWTVRTPPRAAAGTSGRAGVGTGTGSGTGAGAGAGADACACARAEVSRAE